MKRAHLGTGQRVALFVGLVLVLASVGVAPYLGTDQRAGLFVGLVLLLAGIGIAPRLGAGQRVALFVGLVLVLAGIGVGVRPLGHATGELGTLYCTVSPGPVPTTTTLPRPTTSPTTQPRSKPPFILVNPNPPYTPKPSTRLPPNAIGEGPCPSNAYDLSASTEVHSIERDCGSALLPAGYEDGALAGHGKIPDGVTQAWSQVPPCSHRLSTWRYPAVALLIAGGVIALAGFFIFRKRPKREVSEATV